MATIYTPANVKPVSLAVSQQQDLETSPFVRGFLLFTAFYFTAHYVAYLWRAGL